MEGESEEELGQVGHSEGVGVESQSLRETDMRSLLELEAGKMREMDQGVEKEVEPK